MKPQLHIFFLKMPFLVLTSIIKLQLTKRPYKTNPHNEQWEQTVTLVVIGIWYEIHSSYIPTILKSNLHCDLSLYLSHVGFHIKFNPYDQSFARYHHLW